MKTLNASSIAVTLLVALAVGSSVSAQERISEPGIGQRRYLLVEVGTFGGPNSYFTFVGQRPLNNHGMATGGADTSMSVDAAFCFNDCFLAHTFLRQNGTLKDLGGLPDVNVSQSFPNDINEKGVIAGIAFTGGIDPVIDFPEFDAVVWKAGKIVDLGTFGGTFSYASAINDQDQAVGFALNTTPASFDFGDFCFNPPMPTQMRAFISNNGVKQALGTLGGTDSCALFVNERGQTAGHSSTDSITNPATGVPTIHPFLWEHGRMRDLGTLGGTIGVAGGLNNRGQVVGQSNLAGDFTAHPFIWERGSMKDIGTLGGSFGFATSVSDSGAIVGGATNTNDQAFLGFVWKNGMMTNLGALQGDDCSVANKVNSAGQIVGSSFPCAGGPSRAFLWERGSIIDLNAFVPADSELRLTEATSVNDRGEIAAQAMLPNGETRAVMLVSAAGEDAAAQLTAATSEKPYSVPSPFNTRTNTIQTSLTPAQMMAALRARLGKRHQAPALSATKAGDH